MFQTLEATWDQSARRGWTTIASLTLQALGLSLLLLISLLTVQEPPKLRNLIEVFSPPPPPAPPSRGNPRHGIQDSEIHRGQIFQPPAIPDEVHRFVDPDVPAAPDDSSIGVEHSIGRRPDGVFNSTGPDTSVAPPPPPRPVPSHPVKVSTWAEGGVIRKVQPIYPPLARQARIQGAVELRAIIGKTGIIENLTVVSGHAMLLKAAAEAVRQWRYRPYLLNGEPVEVETEITVNFVLSGI